MTMPETTTIAISENPGMKQENPSCATARRRPRRGSPNRRPSAPPRPERPRPAPRFAAALALCAALCASCTGYRLGGAKPSALSEIHSIAVPMFSNKTLEPRVGAMATNRTVDALAADGAYRIASPENADAILEGTVTRIDYTQLRSARLDTMRPTEIGNQITIEWALKDASDPTRTLMRGAAIGTSRFFLGDNVQTARTNALPDALHNAALQIASKLGDGF
jgi:hypothetical protein